MQIELPELHDNQQIIFDSPARFRVVMCGRRFGKSELAQVEITAAALKGEQVAYITPTYQLAKTFFSKLIKALPFEHNKSDLIITCPNDGKIEFYTGERLDNLRGRKFHLVVVDEASFQSNLQEGWQNSIRPTLTDYRGRALFLSTPKGKNYFYSLFMKSGEPNWQCFKFTTYDNPYIDKDEIEEAKRMLPGAVFNQEYMADPMENAANPFGSQHIISCIRPMAQGKAQFYGIDLAKSVDWTVIVGINQAGHVCDFRRFQKDWASTKAEILTLDKGTPVMIDSTGVGDAITEDLQRSFQSMEGFKYTASSKQQLMELLAQQIHQGGVGYPDNEIRRELDIFEYQYTSTGVRYNAPAGFHDDCVNALALAIKCRDKYKHRGQYHII